MTNINEMYKFIEALKVTYDKVQSKRINGEYPRCTFTD